MPLYTGTEINLPNLRVPSAAAHMARFAKTDGYGIRAYDASLGGRNIRVANRKIVITLLKKSLAFDVAVSCFDVNLMAGIMATCAGRVIHVWNVETYILKNSVRRARICTIRSCCINIVGSMIVTSGDDKRIIIWSVEKWRALKSIDGHKGIVYQIEFSTDSEYIYSASDDGRVLKWDWKTGELASPALLRRTLLNSCMRHPFAVRSFDFNYETPELVVCGRGDGHVTVWNVQHSLRIDNIMPDPEWMHHTTEENLLAWSDKDKNHTGSILCVRLSPNGRYLATGSTDHTCKIWNVTSYRKHLDTVQRELQQTEAFLRKLNGYIDISDPSYDEQLKYQEFTSLRIGEVPLSSGYHADLRCTLRHDAPVLCVRFTCNSDITVTGSMDSTCRLWSSRRGELLFQINTPAPVTCIQVDLRDYIFLACHNRLLIFGIKALFKEDELPPYWQGPEIKNVIDRIKTQSDAGRRSKSPEPQEPMSLRSAIKDVSLAELRRLIAHGLVLPRFLDTLLSQYREIDAKQLDANLRRVLRLMITSKFHPRDILKALATKGNTSVLYSLISHASGFATPSGSPITGYMLKLGFAQTDEERDKTMIQLDYRDFQPPSQAGTADRHMMRRPHGDFDYDKWWQGWYKSQEGEEEEEEEDDEDELAIMRPQTQPRGKILHFIPSEQMKLLKDLHASRDVKPIFLRQLAIEKEEGHMFPNFDPQDDVVDSRPIVPKHAIKRQGVRFNETQVRRDDGPAPVPLSEYAGWKGSLSSSRTLFKPERYFQTRGLNVMFGRPSEYDYRMILPGPNGLDAHGLVFSEPILIRESQGQDDRVQLVVGAPESVADGTVEEREPEETVKVQFNQEPAEQQ
ncbi:hypothetical protein HK105_202098 [Polyrhizophydium stewartii]|uniref:Uncharacterized protein n=1 Tax=Polyrhizophydium stewartii TaxID=2732419 RepID=A0ABR4NF70_9FUNG